MDGVCIFGARKALSCACTQESVREQAVAERKNKNSDEGILEERYKRQLDRAKETGDRSVTRERA